MVVVSPSFRSFRSPSQDGDAEPPERLQGEGFEGDFAARRGPPRSAQPLAFPAPPRRERSNADLARMIESEIIPRLMLAHAHAPLAGEDGASQPAIGPRTMEAFARMTLSSDAQTLVAYVETLLQGGLSLEEVYVDLLIPTARRLGDDWNEDFISFTDVTIGLSRLQQVVRTLGHALATRDPDEAARAAYFMPAPGEQHAFGLFILEDYFRRAGWRTWLDTAASETEAARTVSHDWFDIVGVSATRDTPLDLIAATIAQVRRASCNRDLFVMVGGRLFVDDPGLAARVGADATSGTAAEALLIAGDAIRPRTFG